MRFCSIILFLLFNFSVEAQRKRSINEFHFGNIYSYSNGRNPNKRLLTKYPDLKTREVGFFMAIKYKSRSNFHFTNELQILRSKYIKKSGNLNLFLSFKEVRFALNSPFLFSYEIKKKKIAYRFYTGLSFKFGFYSNQFQQNLEALFSWSYLGRFMISIKTKESQLNPFIGIEKNIYHGSNINNVNLAFGFSLHVPKPPKRKRRRK